MNLATLDTPVLLVDLDRVERNVRRLQAHCDAAGLACRPHVKTHKLPAVAHRQLAAGAVGITCQKIGEAEVMARNGIGDILLTFPIVGAPKLRRLVQLARAARLTLVGDSEDVARQQSDALAAEGLRLDFLVDCDTGFHRTGVQTPEDAAALAEAIDRLPGLRFAGLATYPTPQDGGAWLRAAGEAIAARGLSVERVSGGGTPNAFRSSAADGITELRAGTYVYGDRACLADGSSTLDDCALRVCATVVSRPTRDRAILDSGSKALTSDPIAWAGGEGHGLVVEHPEARIYKLSEEHGHVDVSGCADGLEVGEVVTIIPNHACGAVNLYDEVVAHRAGDVVGVWPIAARGRSR